MEVMIAKIPFLMDEHVNQAPLGTYRLTKMEEDTKISEN
jgi:hypothetical protein